MNHTSLIFIVSPLVGILVFAIWSNTYVYAQQSSSPPPLISPPSQSAAQPVSKPQHITKIKITSPTKDQQVPIGKELTVSGTSIDNASANDCKVSVIVNNVKPYQPATATGTGGPNDYSKWNFVLASKYTTIKPGQNRITAKYECVNNPGLKSFSSVNVTGIPAAAATTATTKATTTATAATATGTPKTTSSAAAALTLTPLQTTKSKSATTIATSGSAPKQQHPVTTNNNNPASASKSATVQRVAPVSNVSNKSSSIPTIAPQVNAINQQQKQQQQKLVTASNGTVGQNYTFASTSPVVASDKPMYPGYNGGTDNGSTEKSTTSTKSPSHHSSTNDNSSKDKDSSGTKHTKSTSDSGVHKHKNSKGKNSNESKDRIEGILKGFL